MIWHDHSRLRGTHAILGASKYFWLGYDDRKLSEYYISSQAAARGVELHAFAEQCIRLQQKLPRSKKTLNRYVNDAIGFQMTPELVLYYSDESYGTADAISFDKNVLRIHDLKTGSMPAKMDQLIIYAAWFFLEYHVKPDNVQTILRIYQNDDVVEYQPTPDEVKFVMNKVINGSKIISKMREEENM